MAHSAAEPWHYSAESSRETAEIYSDSSASLQLHIQKITTLLLQWRATETTQFTVDNVNVIGSEIWDPLSRVASEPYPGRQLSWISGKTQHTSSICLNDAGTSRRSTVLYVYRRDKITTLFYFLFALRCNNLRRDIISFTYYVFQAFTQCLRDSLFTEVTSLRLKFSSKFAFTV